MTEEMGPEWVKENAARNKLMSIWYTEDGRNDPNHPKHGLYSGLAQLAKEGKLAGVLADTNQSVAPLNNEK